MPTIITAHMVNVSRTPATPCGASIGIPMPAIVLDDVWPDDDS